MFLDQGAGGRGRSRAFGEAAQIAQTEETMLASPAGRVEHVLAGMASGQVEHALDETEGSDAAFSDRFLGPGMQDGTDPFFGKGRIDVAGALGLN